MVREIEERAHDQSSARTADGARGMIALFRMHKVAAYRQQEAMVSPANPSR
jgi:hypothetical protein